YELNLIDTPGHVDFSYEVSRSLAACEGALLVVDATQGIQAQTLANVYLAIAADLVLVPIINKIDLPAADIEKTKAEIVSLLGCKKEDIISISAKTGEGVETVLERITQDIPAPKVDVGAPTRALIFDSYFDDFRGVILYIRIVDGQLSKGDGIQMLASGAIGNALEVGALRPDLKPTPKLSSGEIGYLVTNLKSARDAHVGDTLTLSSRPAQHPLPGYQQVLPFVYAGFFPESNEDYQGLKSAVERLALNDSALMYTTENSPVLGFGLRIGFLGLLHLDIVRERLEREYGLTLVITNPSTDYHVVMTNGTDLDIKSAAELPDPTLIKEIREPWVKGEIVLPKNYVGALLGLIVAKRGRQTNLSYVEDQALISFEAPLANLLTDFYDQLKSISSGYGSFNYELDDYRAGDLRRLDFLIATERI
ncbi:MAG: translation elongation factor 4, partial [Candidatus Saccharimonadales bacterium]